jgi:hypothetical protein
MVLVLPGSVGENEENEELEKNHVYNFGFGIWNLNYP